MPTVHSLMLESIAFLNISESRHRSFKDRAVFRLIGKLHSHQAETGNMLLSVSSRHNLLLPNLSFLIISLY